MKNKKGQMFEQFGSLAIGIATLAILLVVAFLIMSQGKEVAVNLVTATSVSNESFTFSNATATTLTLDCSLDPTTISCTALHNGTNLIGSGNYSCSGSQITVTDNSVVGFATTLNVTYSCKQQDEAYNSTEELQNATDDIPTWIPIIVITFIGVILLGLVAMFRRK